MTNPTLSLGVLLTALLLAGCGSKLDPVQNGPADASGPISWCDIEPIVSNVCAQCHSSTRQGDDRNGAPVSVNFDSYQDMLDNLDRANTNIQAGTMPPDDVGLTEHQRNLFRWWIEQSTPACATNL